MNCFFVRKRYTDCFISLIFFAMKHIFVLVTFLFLMTSCMGKVFPVSTTGSVIQVPPSPTQTGAVIEEEIQPPLSQTGTGVINEYTLLFENGVMQETVSAFHTV